MKKFARQQYIWLLFLLLVSLGSLTAEFINHRFSMPDLEVYVKAADRLMQGEELYRTAEEDPYEHYVFKYSPPAAMLFIPISFFGSVTAKYVYWGLLTIMLAQILYLSQRIFNTKSAAGTKISLNLILLIIITGTHFFRELHLGQVNLLLLWLYVLAMAAYFRDKEILTGIPLAISIFIKPFALIFVPFLLLTGKFRASISFLLSALTLFLLPLIFYPDVNHYLGLYGSWFKELSIELGNKQDLLEAGNHTLFSLLARFTPLRLIPLDGNTRLVFQVMVLALLGLLLLWNIIREKSVSSRMNMFALLTALIPLLAFTSYNAFIFTLPLLASLIFSFRRLGFFSKILFVVSCLLIGGNIYDLAGPVLFNILWGASVYSWGTIGLIAIYCMEFNRINKSPDLSGIRSAV